jgi:hypothetical protein
MGQATAKAAPPVHTELGRLGPEAPRGSREGVGAEGHPTAEQQAPCGDGTRESGVRRHDEERASGVGERRGLTRAKVLPLAMPAWHDAAAELWAEALEDAGDSGRAAVASIHQAPTRAAQWGDAETGRHPNLAHLVGLARHRPTVLRALVRRLEALAGASERADAEALLRETREALLEVLRKLEARR